MIIITSQNDLLKYNSQKNNSDYELVIINCFIDLECLDISNIQSLFIKNSIINCFEKWDAMKIYFLSIEDSKLINISKNTVIENKYIRVLNFFNCSFDNSSYNFIYNFTQLSTANCDVEIDKDFILSKNINLNEKKELY